MDDAVTTRLMMTSTETNNLDNSKQDRSSNRRMVYGFDGTNRHLLAAKFTVIHDNYDLKCQCKQHVSPLNYRKTHEHLYFCFCICIVRDDLQAPLQELSVC